MRVYCRLTYVIETSREVLLRTEDEGEAKEFFALVVGRTWTADDFRRR